MTINDEILMAYLDGELEPEGFAAVETALAKDPALVQRLDQLAACDERVRLSYQSVLEEPVPPALITAILNAPDPRQVAGRGQRPPAPRTDGWREWIQNTANLLFGDRQGLALASMAIGAVGAWVLWANMPSDEGWQLQAGKPIAERSLLVALETAPSGREVEAKGRQFVLLATFERRDGGMCREFNVSGNAREAIDHLGVACRQPTGSWELAVVASEERPADPARGGYRTASDRQFEVVDAWRLANTSGEPLSPEQERANIDKGWRR